MPDDFREKLEQLVSEFKATLDQTPDVGHDEIHHVFVRRLLGPELLGWPMDVNAYRIEHSLPQEAGIPDGMIHWQAKPLIAVEVKRPNEPAATNRIPEIEQGSEFRPSQLGPELRKKTRYCLYGANAPRWLILTCMTRLHVFDRDAKRWILTFNSLDELASRWSDLLSLSKDAVTAEHSLVRLASYHKRNPIEEFLEKLNEWRTLLAQSLYQINKTNPALLENGEFQFEKLQRAVQRMLDRLVIVQIIDDKGLLVGDPNVQPGFLEHILSLYEHERDTAFVTVAPLIERLKGLFETFNERYNSTIFDKHDCDELIYNNESLAKIVDAIAGTTFRNFDSRVLGTAYERYAGYRLSLDDQDEISREEDMRFRRGTGTYYTPEYIVRYIVKRTVGEYLEGKTVTEIQDFCVLDPACGSGSFLLGAFDEIAAFYKRESERLRGILLRPGINAEERASASEMLSLTTAYPRRILERHLYGVDLNPEATEFATVSLIIHALEYEKEHEPAAGLGLKLPLILNQNIKIGNSLISAVAGPQDGANEGEGNLPTELEQYRAQIPALIELRQQLLGLDDSQQKRALMKEIKELSNEINWGSDGASGLNAALVEYFGDIEGVRKRSPFNWEVEFPEVFNPQQPWEKRGFDCVIGNPPYIRIQEMKKVDPKQVEFYNADPSFEATGSNYDIYVLFLERGLQVSRGSAGYIVQKKFFKTQYGKPLRRVFSGKKSVQEIVDFGWEQVFSESGPTTYTCLLFLSKSPKDSFKYARVKKLLESSEQFEAIAENDTYRDENTRCEILPAHAITPQPWVFLFNDERRVMDKVKNLGVELGDGALTENIFVGLQTSADKVYIVENMGKVDDQTIRVWSRQAQREYELEAALLKPLLSGEDVQRYGTPKVRQFILFPYDISEQNGNKTAQIIAQEEFGQNYPKCWQYLLDNKKVLENREGGRMLGNKWYAYVYPKNLARQEERKLAVPRLVDRLKAIYDPAGDWYLDNVDVGGIQLKADSEAFYLYVLSLLNCKLSSFYLDKVSTRFQSGFFSANKQYLSLVPIRRISFTTAPDERAELLKRGRSLFQQYVNADAGTSDALIGLVRDCADQSPERCDVVHDLLGHLAKNMIELNEKRSAVETDFLKYVDELATGRSLRWYLDNLHANQRERIGGLVRKRGLEIKNVIPRKDGEWVVFKVRAKELDTGAELEEDVYRAKLPEPTASLVEFYLPALTKFARGRTKTVLEKMCAVELPESADDRLPDIVKSYRDALGRAERLDKEIEKTDCVIDRIVYALYGLTDEEIKTVEENVS